MKDTLYIIGNGFDLHHDLPTSYKHFREEYAIKHNAIWNRLYELYGDQIKEDIWWSQFENMLGKVDYISLLSSWNGIPLSSVKVEQFLRKTLPPLFGQWIMNVDKGIGIDTTERIPEINPNALYLTFNYTTILEKVYHVNPNNIWYIHNSVYDYIKQGENPIVGHDISYRDLSDYSDKYREQGLPANKLDEINREVLNGAKNVQKIVDENKERFKELYENINRIIVMGFSFNDIDMPYIEKIISVNQCISNVEWIIYWHSVGEDKVIKDKLYKSGVDEGNIHAIPW